MEFDGELLDRILKDTSTFPNTECYSVHWIGGTGGAFLRALVQMYIHNCPSSDFINKLSEYNNSHDSVVPELFNWDPKSFEGIHQGHVEWLPARHRYIRPMDENMPVIIQDHTEADYNTFWKRWPRGKVLLISLRPVDGHEISFNMYWKAFVQYYGPEDPNNINTFKRLKETKPEIFEKYDHPADISANDLICHLFGSISNFENYEPPPDGMPSFYNEIGDVPEDKKDKVLRIPYYHLTRNHEYTMRLLSKFLGRETNDNVKEFYYTYIERQNKLIEKHGPWLREPGRLWSVPVPMET